jgi:hypothetical protein
MSTVASVPLMPVDARLYQTSGPPYVSVTSGQVLVCVQRWRIPQAGRPARRVGPVDPPRRLLAALLVEVGDVAGLREADVESARLSRTLGPHAVPDDLAVLVFVEAEVDVVLLEPSRLRVPGADHVPDRARQGIGRACVILRLVAEE